MSGDRAFFRRLFRPVAASVLIVAALAGCESSDKPKYVERPVDELYGEGLVELEKDNFKNAAALFDEVDRQHPYSQWAVRSQLMAAYSYYQANEYDDAIGALDRFMRLHPASRDVPYAQYLKGLCYYERISQVSRDQKMTEDARQAFIELVKRYPESEYSRDAKLKLDLINDHLAGKEMDIGRFYLNQQHHVAAINRFRRVVDDFQTTTHVPEALHRLVEAYTAVGLIDEARKTAAVLGHNFPGSEWYIDTYQLVENKQIRIDEEPWYKFW
jgi:outer membrane protein assembly factor BamD